MKGTAVCRWLGVSASLHADPRGRPTAVVSKSVVYLRRGSARLSTRLMQVGDTL